MPDLAEIVRETAAQLDVDEAELGYIEEDLAGDEGEPEEAETYLETEEVDGELVNSFDCRRPRYEGDFLYYYRDCTGPFGRIRRNRIVSIWATGYCGYPVRRYKVRWT